MKEMSTAPWVVVWGPTSTRAGKIPVLRVQRVYGRREAKTPGKVLKSVRGVAKSDGTGAGTAGRCPVPEFHQIGGILDFSAPVFPLFGGIPTQADAPLVPVFGEL